MSFAAFLKFNSTQEVSFKLDPSFMWTMKDVPAPGTIPDDAVGADKRFEGELRYEQLGDVLWGYCLVDSKAAVMSCSASAGEVEVPALLGDCPVAFIGPRVFSLMEDVVGVSLPDTVEEVCGFAFMYSGLKRFDAPAALRTIGTRAFFGCPNLTEVTLSPVLEVIGKEALSTTNVSRLVLPSTIREIGANAFANSGIRLTNPGCTLFIEEGSSCFIDEGGGLYEFTDDGLILRALLNKEVQDFTVADGTLEVCARACAQNTALRSVTLPEGLRFVRDAAFSGCKQLERLELPSTLEGIGAAAFKNCALRQFTIPRDLRHIGYAALAVTVGDINIPPTIRRVEVQEGNELFYVVDDMLCLKGNPETGDILLLYFGRGGEVCIPDAIGVIGPAAFAGQTEVRRLVLHDHISYVDTNGFFFRGGLSEIVFCGAAPDGSDVTVLFPEGAGGTSAVRRCFEQHEVDAPFAMACADEALFGAPERNNRFMLICERLANPLWMSERMRSQFVDSLRRSLVKACVFFAQDNYLLGFDVLSDFGLLNSDNFESALSAVAETGEPAAVTKMLAIQHRQQAGNGLDFDL